MIVYSTVSQLLQKLKMTEFSYHEQRNHELNQSASIFTGNLVAFLVILQYII